MTVKPIKQSFQEQFWRELQAAHKAGHSEQVKQQYDKHRQAVLVSLLTVKDKANGKR